MQCLVALPLHSTIFEDTSGTAARDCCMTEYTARPETLLFGHVNILHPYTRKGSANLYTRHGHGI